MEVKTYVGVIRKAADHLRARARGFVPQTAVILGSGLAKAVPELKDAVMIPYGEIPGFPRTTVAGHEGKLILGKYEGRAVAVMQGRFHYYEGHSMEAITLPIRVLEYLGLKTLLITSAVGSMRDKIHPGDFVSVKDHINFMGRNPLRAFHEEEFGEMFPDLSQAYDPALRKLVMRVCKRHKLRVHEGVYLACGGPSYETPAEIQAFRTLGGDIVGMSVVPEVIVARQMGLRVAALSWVSNKAAGLKGATLSHPDVLALGEKVSTGLSLILSDLLREV